jgi:hypothetical protein
MKPVADGQAITWIAKRNGVGVKYPFIRAETTF